MYIQLIRGESYESRDKGTRTEGFGYGHSGCNSRFRAASKHIKFNGVILNNWEQTKLKRAAIDIAALFSFVDTLLIIAPKLFLRHYPLVVPPDFQEPP